MNARFIAASDYVGQYVESIEVEKTNNENNWIGCKKLEAKFAHVYPIGRGEKKVNTYFPKQEIILVVALSHISRRTVVLFDNCE